MNRVFKDKPGGLIVDYLDLVNQPQCALATSTVSGGAIACGMDIPPDLMEFAMNWPTPISGALLTFIA